MKQLFLKGVLLAAALLPLTASAGPYDLLPKPHSMVITAGQSFALGRAVSVADAFNTPFLRTALEEMGCTITEGAAATVEVKRVAVIPGTYNHSVAYMPNETYTLTVASDKITIEAVTQTGVIRAAQTLLQLASGTNDNGGTASLQALTITDWPAFKVRGFMHDVGRSFIPFEELKHEIDMLSRFKVNVFHWHLTEKLAWRFMVKAYPQLTAADNMTRYAGNYYTQPQCKTLEAYDKYGLQIKNADPGVPAEAAFYLGEHEYHKMEPIVLKGKEKEKAKIIKQLVDILQKAMSQYSKSATYASERWTFKATNKMGMLFVTMAAKIREQELNGKKEEEIFAERIGIVQQLPSYYEQARPIFQKNIDLARDQGFYNQDVIEAEEGYIEMYYQGCAVFVEVADAFANSPLPDSASIVKEYVEYEGMVKEDAMDAVHEDLEAYREELTNRSNGAKELAVPQCATGIKAAAHYGIENQWTEKLFELLKSLDENNETLNTKIEKFDPSTLFSDPAYFKTKARLEQIAKSEVMTPEEQINTYRDIIKDAKAENEKLKAELAELKKQLYAGSASTTSSVDGSDASMGEPAEVAEEPEAAPAPAPKAKKKAKKKKK